MSSPASCARTCASRPVDAEARAQVEDYLRVLAGERRLSPHTLRGYRRDLAACMASCDEQGVARWERLTEHHVRALLAAGHRRGLGGRSLQRRLAALRGLLDHLVRQGRLPANAARGVRAPRAKRRLPRALDVDQAAALMAVPGDGPLAVRDRAMLELLYSSGLRLAELVGLDLARLDLEEGMVAVTGKGAKDRRLPVGRKARAALAAWLAVRAGLAAPDEPAVFVGRHGRRLSARGVQARLRYWSRRLGLEVPVHPHMLRHSCASHLLESSGDLRAVQELLGHADIGTTQIYTHLDFQHLARVHDQAHPRARRRR